MRKLFISVIGVVILLGLGVFVYIQKNQSTNPLWNHIPADIDQVMITNYTTADTMPAQVRGLQQTILAQDNDTSISLLFVQGDKTFSTQAFLSAFAGSGGQVQYSFAQIGANLYVYAPPATLDIYKTMTGEFFAASTIKNILDTMPTMQTITISRVDPERAQIPDPQIATFAQNLAYMLVGFGANKTVEAYLVYKNVQKTIPSTLNSKQRKEYFTDKVLLGLVLDNVFGQAGYTSGDIAESMQYYMSSYGLTEEQITSIVKTLEHSIGLFVYADDALQIGGQIVIPNTDIYPIITQVLSQAQATIAGSLGLLPGQVSVETGENSATYTLSPAGISPLVLRVGKDTKQTTVILNAVMTGQTIARDFDDNDAFALVSVDIGSVQHFLGQIQTVFGIRDVDTLVPTGFVGRLQGAVYQEANALHFVGQLQ